MMLKKLCPKCSTIIPADQRYCTTHARIAEEREKERQKKYDKRIRHTRDAKYAAFYGDSAWINKRQQVMDGYHGLCLWSLFIDNVIKYADEVHHIESLKEAWDKRFDDDNLIPLTHAIHMRVEGESAAKATLRALLDRWSIEYGPPGGSKKVL